MGISSHISDIDSKSHSRQPNLFDEPDDMSASFNRLKSLIAESGPIPFVSAVMYGLNNARKGVTMTEYKPVLKVEGYEGVDRREQKRLH